MHWTDQIRNVKILLVVSAIVIAVASLVVSHYLVKDLAMEERAKMGVWAEAMRSLNLADENTDLNLVLKVIDENHTIPVVVTDNQGNARVEFYNNSYSTRYTISGAGITASGIPYILNQNW